MPQSTQNKSIYDPTEWMTQAEFLKHLAGDVPVTDDLVDRLKIKLWQRILTSHVFFMRNFAICLEKENNELVLTDPWFGQTCLDYAIECQRRNGHAQRIIEIKPRQVGWTQCLLSRAVWTALHPNQNVIIFVPDTDVVRKTMLRVNTIINNLPPWMEVMRSTNNVNLIEFQNPNPRERYDNPGLGSSIACVVPADFRGATNLNLVILSEFSKYHKSLHVPSFMDSLMGGISESANTCVVIDTTPSGHDLFYEPTVKEAVERNPEWVKKWYPKTKKTREDIINGYLGLPDDPTDWVPVFTCWTDHEAYGTKDDSPKGELPKMTAAQRDKMLNGEPGIDKVGTVEKYGYEEETRLMEEHHASLSQIFFRRIKINRNKQPDWRSRLLFFRSELASDHQSCFVSYGRAPFDPRCIDKLYHGVKEPYARGLMSKDKDGVPYLAVNTGGIWDEVRMWITDPKKDAFIIGVDVAHAYENAEADDTFAQVYRRHDMKQAAVYQCKVPPYKIIQQLYLLCKFYNDALLAVETEDGIAYDIVRQLFDMGVTNQYYWKRIDADIPKVTDYLGWETNPRTRGPMQETLVKAISHVEPDGTPTPELSISDMETWQQVANAERDQSGTIAGVGRAHDDALISLMITNYVNLDPYHAYALPSKKEQRAEMNVLMHSVMGDGPQPLEDGIGHNQGEFVA